MSLLSGSGSFDPNTYQYYDVTVPTFTLGAASAGGTYAVTNTTRTFNVNSAIGSTFFTVKRLFHGIDGICWGKQSGSATDTYSIVLQTSIDAQVTWVTGLTFSTDLGGANGGKTFSSPATTLALNGPFTNNQISIRLALTDATDPTTDALTLTNIRCTYQFWIPK